LAGSYTTDEDACALLGRTLSSLNPAAALLASMLRRRLESPTWYLWSLLTESRSAPLTASISIEFSSNTSIGVCAFHVGILYGRE